MFNYKDYYNEDYRKRVNYRAWYLNEKKFLNYIKKIKPTDKVIDIGCGYGYLAEMLPTERIKMYDLNDFRGGATKQFDFKKVDISFEKLPLKDKSQDYVFAMFIFEHIENPFNLLREADRVLKTGGRLIIGFPNGYNLISRILYLFQCKIERWHRSEGHITFMPRNIFFRTLANYKKEDTITNRTENFFERLLYVFVPHIRGNPKISWLAKIVIPLPSCELLSERICYILKKE